MYYPEQRFVIDFYRKNWRITKEREGGELKRKEKDCVDCTATERILGIFPAQKAFNLMYTNPCYSRAKSLNILSDGMAEIREPNDLNNWHPISCVCSREREAARKAPEEERLERIRKARKRC
jgi:hypothetical protein